MGYNSYVSSGQEITLSRPLKATEIRPVRELLDSLSYAGYFLALDVTEQEVEVEDGTLTKRSASGLTTTGNEGKAYDLASELQQVITALPTGITASGYIERIGEEFPDAERLHVSRFAASSP